MKKKSNYTKWLNWGILNVAFMLTFFHRFSMSSVTDTLSQDLSLSSMQLANLASMYFYSYALMQIPVGILVSKYGGKRICFTGMLLSSVGSILFGMTKNIHMLYFFRALVGVGAATVFISVLDVQAKWFESSKFTKLTGYTSLIGNIGGMCAAAPLALLVGYMGWRSSFKLIGVINVIVVALIWFIVRESPRHEEKKAEKEDLKSNTKALLLNGKFISIALLSFTVMGGLMSFQGLWVVPYLKDTYRTAKEVAASIAMVISIASIIANASIGWIEKAISSKKKIITLSGTLFILCLITMVLFGKYKFIGIISMFFMGAGGIVTFVIAISMAKDMLPGNLTSIGISIIDVAAFSGTILLNSVTGRLMDIGKGYSLILINYLAFAIGALILFMFTSRTAEKVVVEKLYS